ncbi:uncharacterized protein N7482_010420 [Penicillium canariense]|uniref:Transcription factor hoxa13 n=1 Tax=Penicillium canariense TaxID=189055 RepID=A0A9W9HLX7_9EURO|nr:uncharacterized protein N7482_010420 [Penicillium canariense]KAJ5151168.1 hypothetical protein N7482_010420 [Penicillium canariense]
MTSLVPRDQTLRSIRDIETQSSSLPVFLSGVQLPIQYLRKSRQVNTSATWKFALATFFPTRVGPPPTAARMAAKENGYVSTGLAINKPNGLQGRDEKSRKTRTRSPLRWTLGLVLRLCIWYTLLTPFLRCPSRLEELNESSPKVCKPYLIARSHVEPHVAPYYDTYAAPYVDQARPYVEVFNQRVYTPALKVAKTGYDKYGAPAWQQAQAFSTAQWTAQVTPRLEAAQDQVHQLYLAQVDPYVQQGVAVVSPYYQKANGAALAVYWNHLVPFYTRSQPFIGKTYSTGQDILTTHVMPGARYTWSSVVYFANSSLWPHVTGLYSEQVEPQLVKIGQRLASYREGKRLRAVVEDMDRYGYTYPSRIDCIWLTLHGSSSSEQTVSSTVSTAKVEPRTSASTTTTSITETPAVKPTLSAEEQSKQARARISSDLQRWQDKFAVAADKGIEDLEERIEEIVSALVASSAKSHGQSLSTALQAVSTEQVSSIKQRINELAETLPEEDAPEAEEASRKKLVDEIRTSAILVRDRAHALRAWSLSFDDELVRRVSAAINSTLNVLDSIRDLGLQEIGTRWAWMDDVTYKDWARYHALKVQIDDWRNEIRKIGMTHKSIAKAKSVATALLDRGMEIAEDTAKELVRLKDVGHWKIAAREVSDNFDSRAEPPPQPPKPVQETGENEASSDNDEVVEEATSSPGGDFSDEGEEQIESETIVESEYEDEPVSDAIFEDERYTAKPAFGVAAATVNSQQEPIFDEDEHNTPQSLANKAGDYYSEASSAFADSTSQAKVLYEIAKSQVMGQMAQSSAPAHAQVLSSIESAYSGAVKYATEEFEARIGAVKATPTSAGPLAHISSVASSRLSEGLSMASELLALHTVPATTSAGLQPFVLDAQRRYYEAVGLAHDHYTAFVSTASEAVYGTPTPTPAPLGFQNIIEQAGSQYVQASSHASASLAAVVASASSMISAADDGKAQSIIDDASSRYHDALSAASLTLSIASASASSAIYGTTPPLQTLASQASENWQILVSKASERIYGTPAPYLQQVVHDRVPQLDAVNAIVSELLVGKQPSFTESVLSKLRVAYETPYPAAAVSAASSYVNEAYGSASSAAGAYVSEVPSVEEIVQQANDQLHAAVEAASVGIYGTSKGRYEQATDAAAEAYSTASAQISGAVYGKESSYIDIAKNNIEQIQSKASAAVYGEEVGAVESATSRLAAAVESAHAQLADLASSASSVASRAAETAASHFDEVTSSIKADDSFTSKDEL